MYDPVIALFISPDSIVPDLYDPQTLNRYAYCRNNPLIYIGPSGFRLEVGAHTAVAGSIRHTSTIITLDTPESVNKFGYNKNFQNRNARGEQYATIGAGPVYGKLKSETNRDRDINLDIKDEIVDVDLKGKNEVNVIRELFENDSNYDDDLDYVFFPNRPNAVDEYNSNSYTSGLLKSVGLEPPSLQSTTPGYSKPVPQYEFNDNSSHREDDLH